MVTAVSNISNQSLAPFAPTRQGTASQTPDSGRQPAAEPTDTLDFSKINTPEKAALLPAYEPALQLGLAGGIAGAFFEALISGFGGGGQAVAPVIVNLMTRTAGKTMQTTYTINLSDRANPVSGKGSVDTYAFTDATTQSGANDKQASSQGSIGPNATLAQFEYDDKGHALHVHRQDGDIKSDLDITLIHSTDGKGAIQGVHEQGNIGGQAYTMDISSKDVPANLKDATSCHISAVGKLGNADIVKDYNVTAPTPYSSGNKQIVVNIHGTGTVAGIPQEIDAKVTTTTS